jgi:hypothetical protein
MRRSRLVRVGQPVDPARSFAIFAALTACCRALVYLHDLLAIGPIVVILTLLVPMYTVGLGDNTGTGGGIPSAYSVFNRGMRRIMDHGHGRRGGTGPSVRRRRRGGYMAASAAKNCDYVALDDDNDPDGGGIWYDDGDGDIRNPINERRRRRRLERLQRRGGDDGGGIVVGEGDDDGVAAATNGDDGVGDDRVDVPVDDAGAATGDDRRRRLPSGGRPMDVGGNAATAVTGGTGRPARGCEGRIWRIISCLGFI